MSKLLPPNASPLERTIAATGTRVETLPVNLRDLWSPSRCPVDLLPWLAWSLAVDEWKDYWDEAAKRAAIADAIQIHRHRGTVWSLKRALAPLGMSIDVIDQASQRARYAALNTLRLDGSWQLDGAMKVRPVELYANLPQIQHWAQFIVRANLADAVRAENFSLLRPLVQKWKPARSWPMFMFWLVFALEIHTQSGSSLLLDKQIGERYPWNGRAIGDADTVRWSLGRVGSLVTLPQAFGTFRLGESRGAISAWRLNGGRIESTAVMQSAASAYVYRLPKLAERIDVPHRRLDGAWRIGSRSTDTESNASITASSVIAVPQQVSISYHEAIRIDYPATPAKLGNRTRLAAWRRLDGRWAVGSNTAERNFGFKIRSDKAIKVKTCTTMASASEAHVSPERLAMRTPTKLAQTNRRLDASWHPGAENRIGRFHLDGRRLRAYKLTLCPRIGQFTIASGAIDADASGRMSSRRLYLNADWRIGGTAAPEFTINIIKERQHG